MKHKTKTTPKGSTYELKSSMSPLEVIWVCKAFCLLAMCQLKLPQQVALTEFKGQVSAKVKVILTTKWSSFEFPTIMAEFMLDALVNYNYPNK